MMTLTKPAARGAEEGRRYVVVVVVVVVVVAVVAVPKVILGRGKVHVVDNGAKPVRMINSVEYREASRRKMSSWENLKVS